MPQDQEQRLPKIVSERMLVVADYQRPYAWERKQLNDLWEDLDLLGAYGTHYAGTLVLRPAEVAGGPDEIQSDDGATLQVCEVVDGQQRLTTCFILLDRIRRQLEALGAGGLDLASQMADRIRATYGTVDVDRVSQTRLKLGTGNQRFWAEVILGDAEYVGPPLLEGQKRLQDAASYFDVKVRGLAQNVSGETFFDRLRDLHRRVTSRLGFLVYEVRSEAEVGVIFETLNERGRALTDLEKAKNYLLYLARMIPDGRSGELAQEINEAWADIFTNLAGQPREMEDQLLRAHWLATQDPDLRAWKRIDSLKARFDRSNYISEATRIVPKERPHEDQERAWARLRGDVAAYVRELRACAFFLKETLDPNASFQPFGSCRAAVLRASGALQRAGNVAIFRPLLFAARLARGRDGNFYVALVRACERYSARVFLIERRRTDAGASRLARLAHDLYLGGDPEVTLREVDSVNWQYAPDSRVAATLESVTENWYGRRGHKYFLYEYEIDVSEAGDLAPFSAFTSDDSRVQRTTEHILPQAPSVDASCWWDRFTPEQHVQYVHALGNLVLTYDNTAYSNKCFGEKRGHHQEAGEPPRPCYAQGRLTQERELVGYSDWTPDAIRQRQVALADWALGRWKIEYPPQGRVEDPGFDADALDVDASPT